MVSVVSNNKRVMLPVRRFKQHTDECGIAAMASIANYFDQNIDYETARKFIPFKARKDGVYTSQQARLLNLLGFDSVTIVTSDLDLVDYSWMRLSRNGILGRLDKLYRYYYRTQRINLKMHEVVKDMLAWLSDTRFDNKLIIDNNFGNHIRRTLNRGLPVGASVNATSLFRMKKWSRRRNPDINGERLDHAVVLRGYDKHGVHVVDSDYGFSFRRSDLRRYESGYYKLSWEKLLTNIPNGDLIFVQ